jgi:hypothetical protein
MGLGPLICPKVGHYSSDERFSQNQYSKGLVHMYGYYYQLPNIVEDHVNMLRPNVSKDYWEANILGRDVSAMFPKTVFWDTYCSGISQDLSFHFFLDGFQDPLWFNHSKVDLISSLDKYKLGMIVLDKKSIQYKVTELKHQIVIAYDQVYDVSALFAPSSNKKHAFDPKVTQILLKKGDDILEQLTQLLFFLKTTINREFKSK